MITIAFGTKSFLLSVYGPTLYFFAPLSVSILVSIKKSNVCHSSYHSEWTENICFLSESHQFSISDEIKFWYYVTDILDFQISQNFKCLYTQISHMSKCSGV